MEIIVILLLKRFKSNTNHFKCSFTFKICLFSNRKVSQCTKTLFTLGPVARGNCNSVRGQVGNSVWGQL